MMQRFLIAALATVLMQLSMPLAAQEEAASASEKAEKPAKPKKPPPDLATLQKQSAEALADQKWVRLYVANRKLENLRPYEPEHMLNIVKAASMLDRKNTAYHYMLSMQQQGMAINLDEVPETENIRGTELYTYINDLMIRAAEPAGDAEAVFSVTEGGVTALGWDESRQKYLVGTTSGALLAVDAEGNSENLLTLANGIADLKLEPVSGSLWLSAGEVFEYDLQSLQQRGRFNLGETASAGALTVAQDGRVFVVDTAGKGIQTKAAADQAFTALDTQGQLAEPLDIVLMRDDSRLIVSDRYKGLFMVDVAASLLFPLPGPDNLNLGGIVSMQNADGKLIILQNAFKPHRLMRLTLDVTGSAIEEMAPMAVAITEFDGLGDSTIHGDKVIYFANSGAMPAPSNVLVMQTALDAGADIVDPAERAMQDMIDGKTQPLHKQ